MVVLGSGVGAAVITNGTIHRGATSSAGGPRLYARRNPPDDGKDADRRHPARMVTGWPAPRPG